MNRRQFSLLAVLFAALALVACAPPYTVIRQAIPNPFVAMRSYSVEPIHFESLQISNVPEAQWMAGRSPESQNSYMVDRQAMVERFVERMTRRNPGLEIIAGPPPSPQTFIIRPILEFMEPTRVRVTYNGRNMQTHIETFARMRVQILNQAGQVMDEFIIMTTVEQSLFNPITFALGGRFRVAADRLSDLTTRYLRDRTGIH